MNYTIFLLSMPGGSEWIMIILLLSFLCISPVLAIVFYLQTKRLRIENKALLEKLLEKNK